MCGKLSGVLRSFCAHRRDIMLSIKKGQCASSRGFSELSNTSANIPRRRILDASSSYDYYRPKWRRNCSEARYTVDPNRMHQVGTPHERNTSIPALLISAIDYRWKSKWDSVSGNRALQFVLLKLKAPTMFHMIGAKATVGRTYDYLNSKSRFVETTSPAWSR
jgi:hypothetical protein